jgi:perosamine synthetase
MNQVIPVAAPRMDEADIAAAVRVLRSGRLVQGREVAAFEDEFSAIAGGRYCVAVSSGTSALWLTLLALGIGPADEVIIPSFTFAAAAVRLTGARPVFADIDPDSYCIDPAAATAAITPRTAAMILVHLFGHPAALGPLGDIAQHRQLALIEDAAQAHGASLNGTPAGAAGTAGCWSFYPTKNMQSIEGGLIATADPQLARRLRLLRNQGMEHRYQYEIAGTNARMSDVNAAIARSQLRRLAAANEARRANAAALTANLSGLPGLALPAVPAGAVHAWNQYTIRVRPGLGERDAFAGDLSRAGVSTAVYYPVPLHRSPAYTTADHLPCTDTAAGQVLSLPVHPGLTDAQLDHIITAITVIAGSRERAA